MKRLIKSVKNVLFLWQKKRQQRKALVEELLEKAYEAVQRMENDPSDGYIDIEKMLSTVKAYEPLRKAIFRTKGMRCYAVIQRFLDAYDRIEDTGQRVNRRYIESELNACKDLFDRVEGRALDSDQRECIVKKDRNHLVIAGAGSGKTTVIVGKVKYLIKRLGIPPDRLLVLSFTNASAEELKNRIQKETKAPVDVFTFHKLGKELIAEAEGKQPLLSDIDLPAFIHEQILSLSEEPYYLSLLNEYFLRYLREYKSIFDFDTEEEYKSYLADQGIRTLQNEEVQSFEEALIADFLHTGGIRYQIRPYIPIKKSKFPYKPMIYLPDYGIVIEHFYIQKPAGGENNNERATGKAPRKYKRYIRKVRRINEKNGNPLIETYSYEQSQGILFESLTQKLKKFHVRFSPLSQEDLKQMLHTKENINRFVSVAASFMHHMKANSLSVMDLSRIRKEYDILRKKRNRMFLNIIAPISYAYDERLRLTEAIDFNDMINKAAFYVRQGTVARRYRYIIVDEYQDISPSRYRLIKALKDRCNADLFCVGDDWQSIYRFAGSNIDLFVSFEKYFGAAQRSFIRTTYRFNNHLALVSSRFILKNPNQIKKTFRCLKEDSYPALRFIYGNRKEDLPGKLREILKTIPSGSFVLLLGRYRDDIHPFLGSGLTVKQTPSGRTFVFYSLRPDISMEFMTVHKSKGLQGDLVFVLNNEAGKFGFPSRMSDDSVMDLLLDRSDPFPYAEERRLFYVALTRAKDTVYLLVNDKNKSVFIQELEKDIAENPELRTPYHCPLCKIGIQEKTTGPYGSFVRCSLYPACEYFMKK
jgi:DNA helicase-4